MDMSYLPLGKDGCEDCRNLECYCDDCTKKILNAVNVESRPTKRAVDGATTCGECGQAGITGNVCPNCGARRAPRQ